MKNIKKTSDLVKKIMKEEPRTRSNFCFLYYMVCLVKNPKVLGMPFGRVLLNLKSLELPPFESVRRARQKIRAAHPELAGTDDVEALRAVNEAIVRNYAKQVNV